MATTQIQSVEEIGQNRIKVTGVRKAQPWEIEWQGRPFHCGSCKDSSSKCCNAKERQECEKCICQSLHGAANKPQKVPFGIMNCKGCDLGKYTQRYCRENGYLENDIIQPVVIYDCSQKAYIAGDKNELSNVQMNNACSGKLVKNEDSTQLIMLAMAAAIGLLVVAVFFF